MSKRGWWRASLIMLTALLLASVAQSLPAQNNQPQRPSLKAVLKVEPVYPEEAENQGVAGRLVLEVTIGTNGEVANAKVLNGHRLLNQAALEAIKQWRFSNTYGKPVTIEMTFKFGDSDELLPAQSQTPALKVVRKVDAVYSEEAKRQGVHGEVAVEITVNEKGEVTGARVKSGDELLRQSALDAVKQFQFANTTDKPVVATITFNFVLGAKDQPAPRKPQG
ncbi:MAG TPA: energy transducer TonB [Blastocatellia bacterium]|nr:energy transducer TonB [Blastocatellia bacterium]